MVIRHYKKLHGQNAVSCAATQPCTITSDHCGSSSDHYLGELHVEVDGLKSNWLEGTGWVEALAQAKVVSTGAADSYLAASHVTRTIHTHHVTASNLHILLKKYYSLYTSLEPGGHTEAFDHWCNRWNLGILQFHFWHTALQLELQIAAGCSDLDTDISTEFNNGTFTVRKTKRVFSSIEQAHEQNSVAVSKEGGWNQTAEALRCWIVARPELVRMTAECEASVDGMHERIAKGSPAVHM
ncbi:hypothetical protein LSAT2_017177 [Lamellibrachia satsuma]|nr:hypothetical protein LSAT2_017177 [Lamellibrachia satsuma]